VNIKDDLGRTPAFISGSKEDIDILDQLLACGADVNSQDCNGNTALHIACRDRSENLAMLLMDRRADPLLNNYDGQAPSDNLEMEFARKLARHYNDCKRKFGLSSRTEAEQSRLEQDVEDGVGPNVPHFTSHHCCMSGEEHDESMCTHVRL